MGMTPPEGYVVIHIRRREFIATLGGAAAWPLAARAQQGERMRRIGFLQGLTESDPEAQARTKAFRQGLDALGWADEQDRNSTCRPGLTICCFQA
jgi:hypothetical protein